MLRRAAQLVVPAYRRGLHTSAACWEEAQSVEKEEFLEKFQKYVSSTTAPPNFPSDFVEAQPVTEASAAVPDKLTLNFYLPYDQIIKGSKVDLVLIPAVTGDFGVMPGHVATVAQLRPGVVTVHSELDKELEKYFVSSGFAFIHADSSAEICAVEAVKVSDLDPEAVRAGLQEYTAKLAAVAAKGMIMKQQQLKLALKFTLHSMQPYHNEVLRSSGEERTKARAPSRLLQNRGG